MPNNQKYNDALKFLISQFPAHYRVKTTVFLNGLLSALAEGDSYVATQVEATRDNLLVLTASGNKLDNLGSLYNVVRGVGTGVLDDDFRQIIPAMGMSPKQITHSLQKVIDIIYGPYASHANITCSAPEPYSLVNKAKLSLMVDGNEIDIFFKTTDAAILSSASAAEVAAAISDHSNGKAIGSVITNTITGENFVNIRTSTIGSQGFIQALGGDVQRAMRFPEVRPTVQLRATWNITRYNGTNELLFTVASGPSPALISAGVRNGDFITIRSDSGFNPKNTGTFKVTYIQQDSFRIAINEGIPESGIYQNHNDDLTFFKPNMGNVFLSARPATLLQTAEKEITVILPVTSPLVKRTLLGGAHFHGGSSVVLSATSNSVTLGSSSGFANTGTIHLISSRFASRGDVSSISGNQINLVNSEGWPSSGAAYSPTTQTFYYYSGITGNSLTGVTPTPPVSLIGAPLKFIHNYSYNGKTGNTLNNVFPNPASTVGYEVSAEVVLTNGFPGSFLYDTAAPFVAAIQKTNLGENILQGSSRTVISVDDVSSFPEQGSFVLEFSSREQEGPIKYLGKVGTKALIIDPGHVFQRDHLTGTTMRLIRQTGPYAPNLDGSDYPVYFTDTSKARSLLASYLGQIVAAGITLKFNIIVPEQKWPVLPQLYANLPLDTTLT